MPAKLPIADFKSQEDWHAYLKKLTPTQLKKIAIALNNILKTEFKLNVKKSTSELLEDIKSLYSVNNSTKLLQLVKGIAAEDLPQPSQNIPKPTKKQILKSLEIERNRILEEAKPLYKALVEADSERAAIIDKYGYYASEGGGIASTAGVDTRFPISKEGDALESKFKKLNVLSNTIPTKLRTLKEKYVPLSIKIGETEKIAGDKWTAMFPLNVIRKTFLAEQKIEKAHEKYLEANRKKR